MVTQNGVRRIMKSTTEGQVAVLAGFLDRYTFDVSEQVKKYIDNNEIGLVLSLALSRGWVDSVSGEGIDWIQNSFDNLLEDLAGIEDTGFDDIFQIEIIAGMEPSL